jgi:hypothetical protein
MFDLTTAVELTKRLYPDGLEALLYKKSPAYALLKKWKSFGGEGKFLVWHYGSSAGASVAFATAQANKSNTALKRPFITRSKEYALASMDGEAMEATEGDKYAVAELFNHAMEDALYNVNRSLALGMFGNGGGARGKLASGSVAGATLTLANASMSKGFEKGMWLQASADDGTTGAVRAGRVQVLSVDRVAGTITATGNWNAGIAAIVNTDYLFREGDFGGVIKGFAAWLPTTAPTGGDSFFGVDRSSDPVRLAGVRYAPASGNYEEILIDAAQLVSDQGDGSPDTVFMNPIDWGNLVKEVGSKRVINVETDKPTIGFEGLALEGGPGTMRIIKEPNCPRFKAFMLELDTWEIWSLKDVPRILERDGNRTLREATADADELRVGGYLQMVCKAPGRNAVITLPAA